MEYFHRSGQPATEAEIAKSKTTARADTIYYTRQDPCGRCGGQGGSEAWRYTGWTCYQCGGHGRGAIREIKLYTRARLDTLEAAQAKRDAKKARAAWLKRRRELRAFLAWINETPERRAAVKRILFTETRNKFIQDLAGKLRNHWELSEKQLSAAMSALDRDAEREAERGTSEFVGEIKDRLELELLVLFVYVTDGYYGSTAITLMKDADGNLFKWFNTGSTRLEKGDRVKIKGTVKGHDIYKGEKQTVLSRCTLLETYTQVSADEAANLEHVA